MKEGLSKCNLRIKVLFHNGEGMHRSIYLEHNHGRGWGWLARTLRTIHDYIAQPKIPPSVEYLYQSHGFSTQHQMGSNGPFRYPWNSLRQSVESTACADSNIRGPSRHHKSKFS